MAPTQKRVPILNRARDRVFHHIHGNNLIYNQCWEDPRLDRQVMEITPESRIVMITSAGCNALDYLLDRPASVHAIDVNPRQNALLELKKAFFENGDHSLLFQALGDGRVDGFGRRYFDELRPHLKNGTREFWDRHLNYFDGTSSRPSFYFHGTSGIFAWMMAKYIRRDKVLKEAVGELLESKSLDEQKHWYARAEKKLWNALSTWFMNRHLVLALLGVPRPQRDLIQQQYPGGLSNFLKDKLRHVFAELPIHDNYFWRVYLTGSYTPSCSPNYLKAQYFEAMRALHPRLTTHTTTLANFLEQNPGEYSHFVLLDHQDWLASHDVEALNVEWELIIQNAAPGAKVLMRSAGLDILFVPEWVHERVSLDEPRAVELHDLDRVGTYGCFAVGTVR